MSDIVSVTRICSVLPGGGGPWTSKVSLPPGVYRIGVVCKSQLAAGDTTVNIAPFVDAAQSRATAGWAIGNGSGGVVASTQMPFASGAVGTTGRVQPSNGSTQVPVGDPVVICTNGFQVTVTKGGSASGDVFELDLVISQVRDAIAPSSVVATTLA